MRIRNSKHLLEEKRRLKKREESLRQGISTSWEDLTSHFRFGSRGTAKKKKAQYTRSSYTSAQEEDDILTSTLAYVGALLGKKLAAKVNEKLMGRSDEEE